MASIIDAVTVKMGRLIKVWNTERPKFSNAKRKYVAVQVEDSDGTNERCLLFTEREIEVAEYRASRNNEDLTNKDFLTDFFD
jgi:hypothetical protein